MAGLLAAFSLLVAASAADASRAPTSAERTDLVRALTDAGVDRCEIGQLRVSVVDPGWAVFEYGYASGETYETCPNAASGLGFLKRAQRGNWRLTASASDVTCGQKGLPPVAVQRDLGHTCHFDYPGSCDWKGRLPRYVEIIDELSAEGVGCGRARALVRAYHAKTARIRANPGRVGPFRCEDEIEGGALYMTCTKLPVRKPFRQVRWFAYFQGH